uniref:Envelopment polyprotein n=1 Tax=Sandfly fever sicilian virus TaxID=28292 RepID=A0A096ZSP7_SFSV|nr:glycoprotein polyprotein [Sandfly fever Sicilian virus]
MFEITILLIVLATLFILVVGNLKLESKMGNSLTSTCFSQNTGPGIIERYWGFEMAKMPGFDLHCRFNEEGDSKYMTHENAMKQIKIVTTAPDTMKFSCRDETESLGLSITNDGTNNMMGPAIIYCDTKEFIRNITTGEQPPRVDYEKLKKNAEEKDATIQRKTKEMEEVRAVLDSRIQIAQHEIQQKENEIQKLRNDLRDAIKKGQEHESMKLRVEESDARVRGLKEELKQLTYKIFDHQATKDELQRAKSEMQSLRKKIKDFESVPQAKKPSNSSVALVTTAVLSLLGSSMAASPEAGMNAAIHINNRPGLGKFALLTTGTEDEHCKKIDYGVTCSRFDHLKSLDRYPFFNSHYHHRALLEAHYDNIVKVSSTTSCNETKFKDTECSKEIRKLAYKCPRGVSGIIYADSKGEIGGIYCKENEELMENCIQCRKVQRKKPQKGLLMQLQDMVCQPDSIDYTGPKQILKGYCKIGMINYRHCEHFASMEEVVPFAIFKNKGKLYMDSMRIRNKDVLEKENFICYGAKENADTDSSNHGGKISVKVTECKNVDPSQSKICSGDSTFCSKFACDNELPEVHCEVAPGAGPIEVYYGGVWIQPMCLGYERAVVLREMPPPVETSEDTCDSCYSECLDSHILVRSTGFMISGAVACSHGACTSLTIMPSTEIMIPYPGMASSIGGDIGIHLSHDEVQVSSHYRVHCEPKDPCVAHSCVICAEGVINYQCHTALSAFVVVTLIVLVVLISLIVLKRCLVLFRVAPAVLLIPFSWIIKLACWTSRKLRISTERRIARINEEIGWRPEEGRATHRMRDRDRRPIPRSAVYLAILFLISVTSACSDHTIASSKIVKCVAKGSKSVCTISGLVNVKAGPIGSETCVTLKGPDSADKKFLTIKTIASELICSEGQSYWTSQYGVECLSSRRCHGVAECKGDACQRWNNTLVSREFQGITNNSVISENRCIEQCGGVGCACFSVYASCLFVHARLRATKREAIKVFNCIDWSHRLVLEITDFNGKKEKVSMTGMTTQFFSWGSMTLALDFEGITGTNSYSFLRSSSGAFSLVDEAMSMEPRRGFLGEIRCSSEAAALTAHKSCIVAPDIIRYKPMTDIVDCSTSLIDPFAVFLRGALPQTRNGKTFSSSIDRKTIQAFTSGIVHASMSLSFDNFEVEFEEERVSCLASFVNITGCYSCNEGARVCIQAAADKNTTLHVHTLDNSLTIVMDVFSPKSTDCRVVHLSTPQVKMDVVYSCDGNYKAMSIVGTLVAMNPFDDRRHEETNSVVVNPKAGRWDFSNWASGLVDWLGGPLKTAGVILGYIILAIVFLVVLVLCVPKLVGLIRTALLKKKL